MEVTVFDEALKGDLEFNYDLSKFKFEQLCNPVMERMIKPLDEAISAANV